MNFKKNKLFINRFLSVSESAIRSCVWLKNDGCSEEQPHSCFAGRQSFLFFRIMGNLIFFFTVVSCFLALCLTDGGMRHWGLCGFLLIKVTKLTSEIWTCLPIEFLMAFDHLVIVFLFLVRSPSIFKVFLSN